MITEVHTPTEGSFSGQKHLWMLTLVAADIDYHPVWQYVQGLHQLIIFGILLVKINIFWGEISNQSDTGAVILFDGSPKKKPFSHIDLDFKCTELQVTLKDFTCTKYTFHQSIFATPVVFANSSTCIVVGH